MATPGNLIIDAYTEPGASPNTNPIGLGLNTILMIELDGRILPPATEKPSEVEEGTECLRWETG